MTLPGNVNTGWVTGTFVDTAGVLMSGSVTFTASPVKILDAGATPPTTILPLPVTVNLSSGSFLKELVATDDADLNPTGFTYNVSFSLKSGSQPVTVDPFDISVPAGASSSPVDLAVVSPVPSADGVHYVGYGSPWMGSAAVASSQTVQAPDGSFIKSGSSRTTRATFDATEQTFWTPVATTGGTLEQAALASTYVQVGYTNHSILEYAAGAPVNDGVTSAATAITAALADIPSGGKQRLWYPPGIYLDDAARTISRGVEMVGDGATILKGTTTVSGNWWLLNANSLRLTNLTFDDSAGKVTGTLLATNTGLSGIEVTRSTLNAPSAITFQGSQVTDLKLRDNLILACREGLRTNGLCVRPELSGNRVTNWRDRGIYILGDASGATTALQILSNTVSDMVFGGTSRYPITIQLGASTPLHSAALVEGNTVLGAGTSYQATSNAGNADCFGLFATDGLRVLGNLARDGGDEGITIDGSSLNVAVEGNICRSNDTSGIAVSNSCKDVSIVGNVCKNNGQNRHSDRTASARAGIWCYNSSNIAISGNTLGDDQGTKTQNYGAVVDTCTNVSFGPDIDAGNATALYFKNGSLNTSIVKATTTAF